MQEVLKLSFSQCRCYCIKSWKECYMKEGCITVSSCSFTTLKLFFPLLICYHVTLVLHTNSVTCALTLLNVDHS